MKFSSIFCYNSTLKKLEKKNFEYSLLIQVQIIAHGSFQIKLDLDEI